MGGLYSPLGFALGGDDVPGVPDHAEVALSRLAEQFKRQPNLEALLRALAAQAQDLETVMGQLSVLPSLPDATGLTLDAIGARVGEARDGFSDDLYRLHIKARIYLNQRSGTLPDLIDMFVALSASGVLVRVTEEVPTSFTLALENVVTDSTVAGYLLRFLRLAKAAGVRAVLWWSEHANADTFAFSGATGKGFNDGFFARGVI